MTYPYNIQMGKNKNKNSTNSRAMKEEKTTLKVNDTYELSPRPEHWSVGERWVYAVKLSPNRKEKQIICDKRLHSNTWNWISRNILTYTHYICMHVDTTYYRKESYCLLNGHKDCLCECTHWLQKFETTGLWNIWRKWWTLLQAEEIIIWTETEQKKLEWHDTQASRRQTF